MGHVPQLQQGARAHGAVRRDGHHEQVFLRVEHDQRPRRPVLRISAHLEGFQEVRLVGARCAGGGSREGEPARALYGDDRPQHAVLGHAQVLARFLHRHHPRRRDARMAQPHGGMDARLHRLRGEAVGRQDRLLHPLRRRHERVVRIRPRTHQLREKQGVAGMVLGEETLLRQGTAVPDIASKRGVREPCLRSRSGTGENRLLEVPQLHHRECHPLLRPRRAQGHPEVEGDRRVLRVLPRQRRQAHVLRAP